MKTTQQSKVLFMAQAAMIAAIYVVLTMLGASFAFGEVQIRFSEALTILDVYKRQVPYNPPTAWPIA